MGSASATGGTREGRRRRCLRPAAIAVALVLLATACGGDDVDERRERRRDRRERGRDRGAPVGPGPVPTLSPVPIAPGALSLGDLRVLSGSPSCPPGRECRVEFEVACPEVREVADGVIDLRMTEGSARGTVAFFSAGRGTSQWGRDAPEVRAWMDGLRRDGFSVVLVAWRLPWLRAAAGEEVGPARLACRSATAIRWIHDEVHRPLDASPRGVGTCGFCLVGDSGGASQVSYGLTHYGLDGLIDAVFAAGGPPHAGLAAGCLRDPRHEDLWYTRYAVPIIDESYGYLDGDGPCARRDPAFAERWAKDGIDTGGVDYAYPRTRVVILFGERDRSGGLGHGLLFVERLRRGGPTAEFRNVEVDGAGHLMSRSPTGLSQLRKLILEGW